MSEDIKKIALAIVQDDDGDVLIVKRKDPEKSPEGIILKWAFPGGVVEDFETPEETVVQEVLEETGHYVDVDSKISERKHNHPGYEIELNYYKCHLTTSATTQLIDDHEIEQVAWVSPSRLKRDYFETDLDKKVAKHLGI